MLNPLRSTAGTIEAIWAVIAMEWCQHLPVIQQFLKFVLVASARLVLHLLIIAGLVEGAGVHYTVAFVVALPFTLSLKFVLNKVWTFR